MDTERPASEHDDYSAAEIRQKPGFSWTAVYTRPRCEKVVADHCARCRVACYLPLRRRAKRYQRRTVETFLPMFPGYVFVQLDSASRVALLRSHKVVTVLPVDSVQEARLVAELGEIQRLEQAELECELEVGPDLVVGKPVVITAGPLRGLTGIVERRHTRCRVSINVEMLGQSVSAELDVGDVEIGEE